MQWFPGARRSRWSSTLAGRRGISVTVASEDWSAVRSLVGTNRRRHAYHRYCAAQVLSLAKCVRPLTLIWPRRSSTAVGKHRRAGLLESPAEREMRRRPSGCQRCTTGSMLAHRFDAFGRLSHKVQMCCAGSRCPLTSGACVDIGLQQISELTACRRRDAARRRHPPGSRLALTPHDRRRYRPRPRAPCPRDTSTDQRRAHPSCIVHARDSYWEGLPACFDRLPPFAVHRAATRTATARSAEAENHGPLGGRMLWRHQATTPEAGTRIGPASHGTSRSAERGSEDICAWRNYKISAIGTSAGALSQRQPSEIGLPDVRTRPLGLPNRRLANGSLVLWTGLVHVDGRLLRRLSNRRRRPPATSVAGECRRGTAPCLPSTRGRRRSSNLQRVEGPAVGKI